MSGRPSDLVHCASGRGGSAGTGRRPAGTVNARCESARRSTGIMTRISLLSIHSGPRAYHGPAPSLQTSGRGGIRGDYPLVVLPCKSSIFTKTTRETYCGGCWSRSQGLGLHRDAQEVSWMRHMLTNVRIHTYQSVHSQSKVQSSIAIARGTHVLLVTFTDMEASELGLTWHRSFVGTSIVMPLPPGRPGQGV